MLCFFDTARVHEDECRDARVEDVRTSMHMARCYSHVQDARVFVCFSLSPSLLSLLTLSFSFLFLVVFFQTGSSLLIDCSATVLSQLWRLASRHNHSVQERDCDYSYRYIKIPQVHHSLHGAFSWC